MSKIRKTLDAGYLRKLNACPEGIHWFEAQDERNTVKVVKKLIKEDRLEWANWLLPRIMPYKKYVAYAVFAAEQVIDIYEEKYPNDNRPRKAIEAAKKCIKNPSKKNRTAAYDAADAAYDAAVAAYDAADAAYDAADAAYAAYDADVSYAVDAASYAAARKATLLKIVRYGIDLLEGD